MVFQRARELLGELQVPYPGHGQTWRRWETLMAVGREDLDLAKVVEAHLDALAILHEITGEAPTEGLWAVWAAEPPQPVLEATQQADGWRLNGTKAWCSGAQHVTDALLTARTDEGPRLFAVHMGHDSVRPQPAQWASAGMAGAGTTSVDFTDVPAEPVGQQPSYLQRTGFWHGGAGVAACWWGGAQHLIDILRASRGSKSSPHLDAHLGACLAWDLVITGAFRTEAEALDSNPHDQHRAQFRAVALRTMVERAALDVIERFSRALGARPFAQDPEAAKAVADLQGFIRQSHSERDEESLAALDAHE